ncbi:vitamin B6 photo-protection and homoeostasis-domain-containing protein [Dimargaris cristalligena]|uniref:Vitamin B6 photo-protection and homoeostasis-domain-containing protein n=1 Tax=Dimargaris cristalligena TaxID=215637 RepID=A0A4P9ZYT7_9FUNG|nr:vitamin B6 photo-protection and homoeostasis-domain-containing protein [Dimargaris cristalligena]|eukprot:RKP38847.1 vitamin B6 photo-protection and homoeostasis-domain-containing protein [Dimargaris cristalligena]
MKVRQRLGSPWWSLRASQLYISNSAAPTALRSPDRPPVPTVPWTTHTATFQPVHYESSRLNQAPAPLRRPLQACADRLWSLNNRIKRTGRRALLAFLPENYPHSVTPEYWGYSKWQFIHSVTGSITGVVSTQSMLFAVGLGSGSIPLAAALNWVIKDGLGQLGGVIYAFKISNRFDSDPKHYKFWSGITLQLATLLEMCTPLFPQWFLVISSVSNIGKNISWLATSAARAQMHQSFTINNNLGDVTAKSGSQSTAAGLIGTGFGVVLSAISPHTMLAVFAIYLPFAVISIYANYRANLEVVSRNLNLQRTELVLEHWFKHIVPTFDVTRDRSTKLVGLNKGM